MPLSQLTERFEQLTARESLSEYNFEHFERRVLLQDLARTLERCGIPPGKLAPAFELPRVGSGSRRLDSLRGKPVLLHFGSFS